MLNFDYLNGKPGFTRLYDFCHTAEITQISNPDESALNSRRALEYLVDIIYYLKSFTLEPRANLFQKVDSEDFKAYINDRDLMMRLRNAGTDHRKFMRMIVVYADITCSNIFFLVS